MVLRTLSADDLPGLMELKTCAGWNQTEEDWLRYLRLSPAGCFGIEVDGTLAASATVMLYGDVLAWIGMVLTLPQFRGRGLARRLMDTACEYAGSRVVRLDASDMGLPLYESLGFVAECPVERWRREPAPCDSREAVGPLRFDCHYDEAVFGADRGELLCDLAREESASVRGAYALGRPGSAAAFFGPCVADSADGAEALLRWFLARHGHERVAMDLFPHHADAARLASTYGFRPFRHLTRMVRKPAAVTLPDPRIYAIAGFEWG